MKTSFHRLQAILDTIKFASTCPILSCLLINNKKKKIERNADLSSFFRTFASKLNENLIKATKNRYERRL